MATNTDDRKVTDIMAEAVSPALIMALVGSLVYFLVEVLYVGEYSWHLLWGLSFLVFAAVLIARISILQGTGKATVYAACLAVPVWLTLQFFVEYPEGSPVAGAKAFVNAGLIALIWWCAHRLTWDCTFLDEKADAGSEGLLQASGLEKPAGTSDDEEAAAPAEEKGGTWWQRYQRYRERQQRRHTPGTWVVYFSLAALPLFGLGQSLIPADEVGRRRYVFWLMAIYVASGLGLLLTTTYLGLRRYLRQRQVRMPAAMTGAWLGMGAALIVGLLVVGALLPRPQAEYSLLSLPGVGSTKREASRWAMREGAPGKGEGRAASQAPRDEPKDAGDRGGQGQQGEGRGQKSDQGEARGSGDKQGSGSGDRQGGQEGKQGKGSGDRQGKQSGERGSGQDKAEKSSGNTKAPATGQGQRDNSGTQRPKGQGQSGQQSSGSGSTSSPDSGSSPSQGGGSFLQSLGAALAALAPILRWLVFAVFALIVLFLVLRGALQFLANFTTWAKELLEALRSWWQALFGWWPQGGGAETEVDAKPPAAPPVPFSAFPNPFHDGRADRLSMPKLIRYSFEALEAWAREHGVGRRADETVLEFAGRLGGEVPALEADVRRLALLYAHVLYGRGPLPRNVRVVLEQFWQRLEMAAEQPLSA